METKGLLAMLGASVFLALSPQKANADILKLNVTSSGVRTPDPLIEHRLGGNDSYEGNDLNYMSPGQPVIDFYSIVEGHQLSWDVRSSGSLNSVNTEMYGNGLSSAVNATLQPQIQEDNGVFTNKNIYLDQFSVTNNVRANLISTCDIKAMFATNGLVSLTGITNGRSREFVVRFVHINTPPVAGNFFGSVNTGVLSKVPKTNLTSIATDADGDAISLVGLVGSMSTNGMPIGISGNYVVYLAPKTNVVDAFDYTLSDGHGGNASGRAVINVNEPQEQTQNIRLEMLSDNNCRINGLGIVGQKYRVQASPTVQNPVWVDISGDLTADSTGAFYADDLTSTNFQQRYYRSRFSPTENLSLPNGNNYNFQNPVSGSNKVNNNGKSVKKYEKAEY